jgi:hypothetical protein
MKSVVSTIILSVAIVATAIILGNAFQNRFKHNDIINVTGLGKKDFTSDLIVWSGSFTRKSMELKISYSELERDKGIIHQYLIEKGVNESEIVFNSIEILNEYEFSYDKNGRQTQVFTGQRLTQRVTIESREVDKIEGLAREITDLINKGVEFSSYPPEYYYTGLAELKIEMIAAATEDGRVRAEQIAANAGAKLGGLKSASMGVFQIIAQNSSEDFSWGGTFNTMSKKKTATITMKLQFGIR